MTYSSIHQYMLLFFIGLVLMFDGTSSSQYIFPPGLKEINTPVMTNGFVGGPTDFSVTANVSLQIPGCESYSAAGMIVVIPIGHCGREHQFSLAKESGAAGVIFSDYDVPGVIGRRSRVPLSNEPLTIPVVIMSGPDYYKLRDMIVNQTVPYVTIQITPGVSQWHQNVGYTAWFITLNIVFGLFYIALLALVIYKFIRKVRCTGFVLNISFVYLGLQAVFCIMMIVRWMDPLLTWGIISSMADAFIDTWPATWSFAALILMAFFWFEVINQFADTKVQAFLSKKMQIPFWILVGVIILLPAINAILLSFVTIRNLFFALLGISLGAGMLVACFYIIVAVKALQVIKRSERLNVDKKSRVRGLMRSRVSIIISAIIACIYPPCNFVLRYYIIGGNMFFGLAALYEESVLLGLIMFIQVWFMPEKSPGMSSTSKGSQSMNSMKHIKDNTNVTSTNSTVEV